MNLADIVFFGIVGLTLGGALMAVALRNVFYNALSLIVCLFGVAGLFIYLNSEFLAVMEVIVYIGAISIAIVFAIMLSRPMFNTEAPLRKTKVLRSMIVALFVFLGLQKAIQKSDWPVVSPEGDFSIAAIGKHFLSQSVLPFEVISLVLLVAIIGALILSSSDPGDAA